MLNGVLVIAGTDSSNGAGLTLDLRVINDIGIYGFGAVTCVTAQNLNEILSIDFILDFITEFSEKVIDFK